jgi:tetratricopeptide (TPR) repeat protein
MSTSSVVRLDDYRGKRRQRLRQALALSRPDPERARLTDQLREIIALVGADRAGVVWVDEYGPALVHVHCIVDLFSDVPRISFPAKSLRAAWEDGIPGLADLPNLDRSEAKLASDGPRSLAAVALGSDGARAWFLAVDSVLPRRALTEEVRGELMFLAGEAASIVLHRDDAAGSQGRGSPEESGFAGWPVLKDIEGRENDEALNRRIAARFLVVRAVRGLVDDDFAALPESLTRQVAGVRREILTLPSRDSEVRLWDEVLAALERQELPELAFTTLELARHVERQDHLSGALELCRLAFRLAGIAGSATVAMDAARFHGRIFRRLARWDEATRWYGYAKEIARCVGDGGRESVILDGLASTYRDRGNLPGARELLHEALALGRQAGDRYAEGSAHHSLAVIEKMSGHLDRAISHGWSAVRTHGEGEPWLAALTDLAGVFVEVGELQAAEDAYTIVMGSSGSYVYRTYALDALAYVAALSGNQQEFERRAARADASGWTEAAPAIRAEFSYFRGKSWEALGDLKAASHWYERALALADRHGLNKIYFDAEAALGRLADLSSATAEDSVATTRDAVPEVMDGIREELTAMRAALTELVG